MYLQNTQKHHNRILILKVRFFLSWGPQTPLTRAGSYISKKTTNVYREQVRATREQKNSPTGHTAKRTHNWHGIL
jgi:hypothetical protein